MLKLHLFAGFGVEIEYMIVQRESLDVVSIADEILHAIAGSYVSEVISPHENTAWSNELVTHVIELKTRGPASEIAALPKFFSQDIASINALLAKFDAQLLPTGAHPWMDPACDAKIWPHENSPIYEAFHRVFGCGGHGWTNLQSVHLNLPFFDDAEFAKLHTAIRLVLPLLPALAASSPLLDGKFTGAIDGRLLAYQNNQRLIPEIAGCVIPEAVASRDEYERKILAPMYVAIRAHDQSGILEEEWLNSRGAIARFERNTIEIRLLDTQECPAADCAILSIIVAFLKALIAEEWQSFATQFQFDEKKLAVIFNDIVKHGQESIITDGDYLAALGMPGSEQKISARDLWRHIVDDLVARKIFTDPASLSIINFILQHGNLSTRILRALSGNFERAKIRDVYRKLGKCLAASEMF